MSVFDNRTLNEEEKRNLKIAVEDTVEAMRQIDDLNNHIIYRHDETSLMPYCCSISLYPFLLNGLKELGGSSDVPKHADSFIGGLINLVFLVAGQFAGLPATKIRNAFKALGFADVVEVAVGADLCTIEEAKDFMEEVPEKQPFMATSCSTYVWNIVRMRCCRSTPTTMSSTRNSTGNSSSAVLRLSSLWRTFSAFMGTPLLPHTSRDG